MRIWNIFSFVGIAPTLGEIFYELISIINVNYLKCMLSKCNFFTKSLKFMCNTTFLYKFDPRNSFLILFLRFKVKVIISF